MNTLETIGLVATVVGTVIGYLGYKASVSVKETQKIATEKFDFLKRINDELLLDLFDYGKRMNAFHEIFMQGLTLQQCIDVLKRAALEILTPKNRTVLANSKSKMRLDEIIRQLDPQIKHHSEVRTQFDYFINRTK